MANNSSETRRVDQLGRIVLPKTVRAALDIKENDELDVTLDGDKIVIKAHTATCVFCGETEDLADFKGKKVCPNCKKELAK